MMTGIPFFNRKVYALDDDECPPEPESKNIKVSDVSRCHFIIIIKKEKIIIIMRMIIMLLCLH